MESASITRGEFQNLTKEMKELGNKFDEKFEKLNSRLIKIETIIYIIGIIFTFATVLTGIIFAFKSIPN